MEVNKELSKMCDKKKLLFLNHSNINPKTHLNKSRPYLNRNGYEKLGKNFVNLSGATILDFLKLMKKQILIQVFLQLTQL